jgi:Protein of unknown function (DUF1569)
MKNLFEKEATDEVLSRIDKLQPDSQRQWGKMDVAQMMAHCSSAMDMASGTVKLKRIFLGRILGPLIKPIYTNEKPFSKGNPTAKELVISGQKEFLREQVILKQKIWEFHKAGAAGCTPHPHPFFGKLTPDDWARGMYKHLDHHLRQFGA